MKTKEQILEAITAIEKNAETSQKNMEDCASRKNYLGAREGQMDYKKNIEIAKWLKWVLD